MGFGDPYHKHPLRYVMLPEEQNPRPNCSHCELPITTGWNIGCTRCDYYIHSFCNDLPRTWWHPLHDQHPLTLSISSPQFSSNPNCLCNKCRNPCLERFTYNCSTCAFILHLKCFFTIDHVKHEHPLIFTQFPIHSNNPPPDCGVCGLRVNEFNFYCLNCKFIVHYECTLIPFKVKHHHVHELTIRYDFPEECDQVYCDRCEDWDGKEMDRELSYYYCKKCDYIAHVGCVVEPKEDVVLFERFTHEHPLRLMKKPCDGIIDDEVSRYDFHCDQCDYVVDEWGDEFPTLIKHPRHPEHGIAFVEDSKLFRCTVCDFTLDYDSALEFSHPLFENSVRFTTCNWLFRCDACGELGRGSSMGNEGDFDLHLECFALPGKFKHEGHLDHPLYLYSDQRKVLLYDESTSKNCNVCNEEIDPNLWIYCCRECDFVAHLNCIASDLLSTLRSSIRNQPDFCAIIEPEKASFELQISEIKVPETVSMSPPHGVSDGSGSPPPLLRKSQITGKDDYGEENCDIGGLEELDDVLHCPKCNVLIATQAKYSYIDDWESSHFDYYMKNTITSLNYQTPLQSEPLTLNLTLLSEQVIDELYCPICSLVIFPPTYSCELCQIYFHKSCAELPRKCLSVEELSYVLVAPPFCNNLSDCSKCKYPITGYAYLLSTSEVILDVQCALNAPLVKRMNHEHRVFSRRLKRGTLICRACRTCIDEGTILIGCPRKYCKFYLHVECALLPPIIKHRIHKHPLGIATDLVELDDEYICDACEKALNPNLWAYRCLEDTCGGYATSHVSCVITSKKKCHFRYDQECQNLTEEQKLDFLKKAKVRGIR